MSALGPLESVTGEKNGGAPVLSRALVLGHTGIFHTLIADLTE